MAESEQQEKSELARQEEETLAFWERHQIFKETLNKKAPKGEFIFYDGPPFATGLPHYGHILAGTIKDVIPRFKTMRGYHVPRRWGWDCHGLPLENEIEKELGLATKKDIEELGVEKFNAAAKAAVLRYADDWRRIVPRMGRFVDMGDDYRTMDASYTESVWWAFNELYQKGLIYEGFKTMHLCPRCGTTLSNFEVQQGYKDVVDLAVTVKFELKDEPGTYLLAWTTTPWTLPGNAALAVNKEVVYLKARSGQDTVIVAKERVGVLADGYEALEELEGAKLIGKQYIPPFDYYYNTRFEKTLKKERAWEVYHADYVSTEEGTGIVHIAPAFGEEDLQLAQEQRIPIIHHVDKDGRFTDQVKDFAGRLAKPKDDPQSTDIEIIKYLAHRGFLFAKEKVTHAYPHCWRCDTPLLNYAAESWFVRVTDIRSKLVAENKRIHWVPESVGTGRFGKWLEGTRDWAISRSRYWGAPLPVWKNEKTDKVVSIGSIEDLKKYVRKSGNRYFMMRHGEAESNKNGTVGSHVDAPNHLTEKGKEQVLSALKKIKENQIDIIITSPIVRAKETAVILKDALGLSDDVFVLDERLCEIGFGSFEGKPRNEYWSLFSTPEERFVKAPEGGETISSVRRRVGEFLNEIEKTYQKRNILIVAHEDVSWMLTAVAHGLDEKGAMVLKGTTDDFIKNAEVRELSFVPLPHNRDYELDLHRPYIDEVELVDKDGTPLKRIPDVFDCWFESGSMPYAQQHYPFENKDVFNPRSGWFGKAKGFPADFIAEGLDQTRGWFYSLLVLSVALFRKGPYRNVIVNGTILAEDGQKMSKRLKNYPDPMDIVNRYGADALRFYLISSPAVRAEDFNFVGQGVAEVMRKNIMRLANVLSFYELYADGVIEQRAQSTHVLDRWVTARLNALIAEVTEGLEHYELDRAARSVSVFIDDLSTWYVRRSRDRFRGEDEDDKVAALATTQLVLIELSKVIAPFMPFLSERVYRNVIRAHDAEPVSVHLQDWPRAGAIDEDLLEQMARVRHVVSLGLEARVRAGIRVRQPLASLNIKNGNEDLQKDETLLQLIKDEVNVKEVFFNPSLEAEVEIDTNVTPELKAEGMMRDLVRHVQDMRKRSGLSPHDQAVLTVATSEVGRALLKRFEHELKQNTSLSSVVFADKSEGEQFKTGETSFNLSIKAQS